MLMYRACQMELVAESIEGMEKLAKALGRSKSDNKEKDDGHLRACLLEVRFPATYFTCILAIAFPGR